MKSWLYSVQKGDYIKVIIPRHTVEEERVTKLIKSGKKSLFLRNGMCFSKITGEQIQRKGISAYIKSRNRLEPFMKHHNIEVGGK